MLKLLKLLRPFILGVVGAMTLTFLQALSQLYLPNLMSRIVDVGIVTGNTTYIIRVGGVMMFVALLGVICSVGASFLSARTGMGYGRNLRSKVFERAGSFSLQEFDQIGTASLITRTTNDITQVQQVIMMSMRLMVRAPMMGIGGIAMIVTRDARLSLVLAGSMPLIVGFIFIISRKAIPLFRSIQQKLDRVNLVLRERLTGIRVVRAFNRVESEKKRFNEANFDLTSTSIKVSKLMAFVMPMMMLLLNLTIVAVFWVGSYRIDTGNLQVGDLMASIQYIMQIMFALMMMSMMFVMIPRASVSAARINEVLDTVPEINDPTTPKVAQQRQGVVVFKEVLFSYPGAEKPVLEDISFTANPGEVTAIIGGTGSGKSTLINLIPRFYEIDKGSISIDNVDIRDMTQQDLRQQIGFIPQQALLFTGSVADNIRYGKEDASEEEVMHAAETAQALDFIMANKDGFDTIVSQGGANLSGGQKQRISIARALVRRPKVYIFDDSFSALDFKTDAKLRAALKHETAMATVIIVAQRVSTVMHAEQIIVLDNGKIVGQGTHKQLLANNGVYQEIVATQFSEEELA